MIGSIVGMGAAASAIVMAMASGPALGQNLGTLLCPAYADAARVTAEGALAGVSMVEAIEMADRSVDDNDVRLVLKVVIAFVYQERPTPSDAHDIILDACMGGRW